MMLDTFNKEQTNNLVEQINKIPKYEMMLKTLYGIRPKIKDNPETIIHLDAKIRNCKNTIINLEYLVNKCVLELM